MFGILRGDLGQSFAWRAPVGDPIWDRLLLTVVLSLSTLFLMWLIAFPVGIYSAVKKYSAGNYVVTFLGFLGMATPNFLLALVLMVVAFVHFSKVWAVSFLLILSTRRGACRECGICWNISGSRC